VRKRHIATDTAGSLLEAVVHEANFMTGMVLSPKRWVVERTFAWLGRCRRLAKDWERSASSSLNWLFIVAIRRMTRTIARNIINHKVCFMSQTLK